MNRLSFSIVILFLIIPTIFLGGATYYLLRHERERITQQSQREAEFKARAIADKIASTVTAVQADLHEALSTIDESNPIETLEREKRTNPLIRNVFVWRPGFGLIHPSTTQWISEEESRFLARYDRLFRETLPWWNSQENRSDSSADTRQMMSLKQQAQLNVSNLDLDVEKGWERWFWEDRLFLLGWFQAGEGRPVRGVEIEMISLMSQILPELGAFEEDPATYGIVDQNGILFHQIGPAEIPSSPDDADFWVPVGNALPQWQVAVYLAGGVGDKTGDRFFLIAGLLLVLVVTAIVLSGVNLFLTARRHIRDARQKSTFVSNVSHELKTPLTSIRMYAELLGQDRVKDPQKKRHLLDVIVDESCRLSRLVQNVLEFSRLEQGRKKYQTEKTDLAELVTRVIHQQSHRIRENSMDLVTHIPEDPIWVWVDHDALEQVMLNLIDNAIKYGRSDSVENELRIDLRVGNSKARIAVKDRGKGIPKALTEKIFEKFFRVDDSLTADQGGSGIGLGIARLLMRDMGGDLHYEPRSGGGSCFEVQIPVLEKEAVHDG